ncbi:hypothetical protein EV648_10756 [Kribbella sp. VKM Ac-2568]|nr:hypothetical protein EV648_10756 [Kribbella sp. VKM Ac-2568]
MSRAWVIAGPTHSQSEYRSSQACPSPAVCASKAAAVSAGSGWISAQPPVLSGLPTGEGALDHSRPWDLQAAPVPEPEVPDPVEP